jgi:hypothetical protein
MGRNGLHGITSWTGIVKASSPANQAYRRAAFSMSHRSNKLERHKSIDWKDEQVVRAVYLSLSLALPHGVWRNG